MSLMYDFVQQKLTQHCKANIHQKKRKNLRGLLTTELEMLSRQSMKETQSCEEFRAGYMLGAGVMGAGKSKYFGFSNTRKVENLFPMKTESTWEQSYTLN